MARGLVNSHKIQNCNATRCACWFPTDNLITRALRVARSEPPRPIVFYYCSRPITMTVAQKLSEPQLEETLAECPFRIEYPNTSRSKKFKRALASGSDSSVDSRHEPRVQTSPFTMTSERENSLSEANQLFLVQPAPKWLKMNKYKNFVRKVTTRHLGLPRLGPPNLS